MALLFESIYLDLLTVFGVLFGSLYWYFTANNDYWKKKGAFHLKPTPFLGNTKDFLFGRVSNGELFQSLYNQLGDHKYGGYFQSLRPNLLLKDPELIKQFMVKDFSHFHDRGLPVDPKGNPMSENLFNLEGARWRKLRVKLTPTFTSGKMKMMFHVMSECARELKEYLAESARKEENLEIKDILGKFTTDIIGTSAFGIQCNSMKDPNSEFRIMGKRIFVSTLGASLRRLMMIMFPTLAKYLHIQFPTKDVSDFFLSAVKETVDYREKNHVVRNDFLQLLIQLKNKGKLEEEHDTAIANGKIENGKIEQNTHHKSGKENDDIELTDNLLAAQVFVFFLAGFETSSSAMSFCLHELAVNPDIQTRAREEIDTVLAEHDGEITYEAIQKMEYLDKVVAEALRKYPPVPILLRKTTKAYTIPETDISIEEGMRVIIPTFALQRDPKYFPDPERFDPERFTEENKAKRHHYTYLPFGEGPRICIGMRFGLMQTKVGLTALLHNYEFSVCEKTDIPLRFDPRTFVLSTRSGMWLKIKNRA